MMLAKKHRSHDGKVILAVCDEDLVGKKFEEGEAVLDVSSDFFGGDQINEEELQKQLRGSYVVNAIGKSTIDFLRKLGHVDETKTVDGIPHAMIVFAQE